MRRLALLALGAALLSLTQLHFLNLASGQTNFELPLTALLLAAPFLKPVERLAGVIGAALPLDWQSILPFGTFSLAFALTLLGASFLSLRLPIREHRALQLGLVAFGTLTAFFGLLVIAQTAHWLRLGPWTLSAPFGHLLTTALATVARALVLAFLVLAALRISHALAHRRYAPR